MPSPASKWAAFGFTTTPDERIGPGPPYSYPTLQVNLFFRIFLGFISLFVTWVPARLLWRNGEFAGAVLCVTLLVINFLTVVNALTWRDNNVAEWWAGYGWCDIQAYVQFALHSAFNISLFEIMRSLASKVALNRAVTLTARERRRQRIISAAVIFTVPVIQIVLTYFVIVGRYNVSTLVGCSPVYFPSWIYLVFYIVPTPVFIFLATAMAGLTFYRYRKIEKVTRGAVSDEDSVAAARQARVRKKLYFMTLAVIIVVLPLTMILLVNNIRGGAPWGRPYNFNAVHFGPDPFNIYFISFTTSNLMSFPALAINFIPLVAGILVFIPFGTTPEALNLYRKCFLAVGLGYLFPGLRKEYNPDQRRGSRSRWWSSLTRSLRGKGLLTSRSSAGSAQNNSLLPTSAQHSLSSQSEKPCCPPSAATATQPRDMTIALDSAVPMSQWPEKSAATAESSTTPHHNNKNNNNPWPDLSVSDLDAATAQLERGTQPHPRNPTSGLRSALAALALPSFHNKAASSSSSSASRSHQRCPSDPSNHPSFGPSTSPMPSAIPPPPSLPLPRSLPVPVAATTTTAATKTSTSPCPWTVTPSSAPTPSSRTGAGTGTHTRTQPQVVGVDTRVWAADPVHNSDHGEEEEEEDDDDRDCDCDGFTGTGSSNNKNKKKKNKLAATGGKNAQRERGGGGVVVHVETSIAQRSMSMPMEGGGELGNGDGNGNEDRDRDRGRGRGRGGGGGVEVDSTAAS